MFALQPVNREQLQAPRDSAPVRLKLTVLWRHTFCEALVRTLIGTCGLHVDVNLTGGGEAVELIIEGEVGPEDVALLVPNLEELVALEPNWQVGMTGVMQLIVLTQAAYAIGAAEVGQ